MDLYVSDTQSKKNRIESIDNNDDSKTRNKFELFSAKLLEILECPVCMEVVRSAPIYCCRAGHLVCNQCRPKLIICPICRSPDIGFRNILLEQIAFPVLDDMQMKCINHLFGCKQNDIGKNLQDHLKNCRYEQVRCPAYHHDNCTWQGNLFQSVSHAVHNKCAYVLRYSEDKHFRSSICDFSKGETIFKRIEKVYFKPIFLLSNTIVRFFLYLNIYREGSGEWVISMRSLAHKDITKNILFELKLLQHTSLDDSTKSNEYKFYYIGRVHHETVTDADIVKSGHYLHLSDIQVQTLTREKTIFDYTISILSCHEENGNVTITPIHPKTKNQQIAY